MKHRAESPIILVIGTRPEGIKLLPLYFAFKNAQIPVILCSTLQHTELLLEVFDLFGVNPDYSFDIMRPGQDLFYITQSVLQKTKELFAYLKPSLVIVQGDTTSGMAAGLSAFYLKIPVAHIEAGLRTDDIYAPFPEEMNRRVLASLSTYHFAPTSWAAAQLMAEGVRKDTVFCVGNTVVDALRIIKEKIASDEVRVHELIKQRVHNAKLSHKKIMLLTMHRRESFGEGVQRVLHTLREWLQEHEDVICFYPYHPNPHIVEALQTSRFMQLKNAFLMEPLAYTELVYVLDHADIVVTDSGGIQEEAVSLGKLVIVLREKTERIEAIWAGAAYLVGTDTDMIKKALSITLNSRQVSMCTKQLFGDGFAAEKIVHILRERVDFSTVSVGSQQQVVKKRNQSMKKVSVIGLGYIGLPTSIVLAQSGYMVIGVDIDQQKVNAINAGDAVIQEPELFEKLQTVLGDKLFYATTVMQEADYFMIAVPTPFKEDKKADVSYVFSAVHAIATVLKKGDSVIVESTVPVGITQKVADMLSDATGLIAGEDFFVAHCPERVLPGNIFYELVHNARIIGGINKKSIELVKELYSAFVTAELYLTDSKTAELVKLIENSSRDVQIAFAHQVASMAHSIGLDPYEIIELANKHPRVKILRPSCGVGGHCLAVDPWFLVESFTQEAQLLKNAREINDNRPFEVVQQIEQAILEWQKVHHRVPVLTLCGITYKPDVDDIRESPAIVVAQALQKYAPIVCDPWVKREFLHKMFGEKVFKTTDAIDHADIVVFLVAHARFKAIDASCLVHKKILDFCGIMHKPKEMHASQEYYFWPASRDAEVSFVGECDNKKERMIE